MAEGVRLNKALATAGLCSRRKADEHIFAGQVQVNGQVADNPGIRVVPGRDAVLFKGKPVRWPEEQPCVLMLHKPVEVVSTAHDPEGRSTVLDFIPQQFRNRRLYPVGRLDYFSEGLILLTDDGELANRLMHPSWHLPRKYEVRVRPEKGSTVPPAALAAMRGGMTLREGERLAPVDVEVRSHPQQKGAGVLLHMTLHQGINRQIRRMCRDTGLTVLRLKRIGQGPLRLGELPPGQVRELHSAELAALRKAVQLA